MSQHPIPPEMDFTAYYAPQPLQGEHRAVRRYHCAPATVGRGQLARLFRPCCLGTNGRGVRRVLQVSERERCTTA